MKGPKGVDGQAPTGEKTQEPQWCPLKGSNGKKGRKLRITGEGGMRKYFRADGVKRGLKEKKDTGGGWEAQAQVQKSTPKPS